MIGTSHLEDEDAARRARWLGAGLLSWLSESLPAPSAVAAEIRALADRHPGEPMNGATLELGRPGLSPPRAALMRACIRSMNEA